MLAALFHSQNVQMQNKQTQGLLLDSGTTDSYSWFRPKPTTQLTPRYSWQYCSFNLHSNLQSVCEYKREIVLMQAFLI